MDEKLQERRTAYLVQRAKSVETNRNDITEIVNDKECPFSKEQKDTILKCFDILVEHFDEFRVYAAVMDEDVDASANLLIGGVARSTTIAAIIEAELKNHRVRMLVLNRLIDSMGENTYMTDLLTGDKDI